MNGLLGKVGLLDAAIFPQPNCNVQMIHEMCGILPYMCAEGTADTLKERLENGYGFPVTWTQDADIGESGEYEYPGDPILYPIMKLSLGNETVYIYHYGRVALVTIEEDGSRVTQQTRMD